MRPCSLTPSMGIVAAQLTELEPEKDRWRRVVRHWYALATVSVEGDECSSPHC
jgi:hypothetical protein